LEINNNKKKSMIIIQIIQNFLINFRVLLNFQLKLINIIKKIEKIFEEYYK